MPVLCTLIVAGVLGSAGAAGQALTITTHRGGSTEALPALVIAEPLAASQGLRRMSFEASEGKVRIKLDPGLWRLTASRRGYWSWPLEVYVDGAALEPGEASLELWPVGRLAASFSAADKPLPAHASIVLRRRFGPLPGDADSAPTIICPLAGDELACELPSGKLDLEVRVGSFIPHYLWDVVIQAGAKTSVGRLALVRGSTVSGWVLSQAERWTPRATVRLSSKQARSSSLKQGFAVEARANDRGFFQIGPVPPATYELAAHAGEHTSIEVRTRLWPDREERLRRPLLLQRSMSLRVDVDPPSDPADRPWRINLRAMHGGHGHGVVADAVASREGTWSQEKLRGGRYRLALTSSSGDKWYESEFDLNPETAAQQIHLELVRLRGLVLRGEEPLPAKLTLMNRRAGVRLALMSGDDGRFSAPMPRLVELQDSWDVAVESSNPEIRRHISELPIEFLGDTEAQVTIRLPDAQIRGTVLDEHGSRYMDDCLILAQRMDSDSDTAVVQARLSPSDQGRFVLDGIAAGRYRIHATARSGLQSPEAEASAAAERSQSARVELQLRSSISLRGRVMSSDEPVPGAEVVVVSLENPSVAVAPTITDGQGRFNARVAPGTNSVGVTVAALGFARRSFRQVLQRPGGLGVGGEIEIDLEALGGTLILAAVPGTDRSDLYLTHDGAFEALPALERWSSANLGSTVEELRIPQMAPGMYQLCRAGWPEYEALLAGSLPRDRCSGGYLSVGGELHLAIPMAQPPQE